MVYIPPGDYCFDIINIDFATQETEIEFCDYFEDGCPPKCLLKDVEMEDGTKICIDEECESIS